PRLHPSTRKQAVVNRETAEQREIGCDRQLPDERRNGFVPDEEICIGAIRERGSEKSATDPDKDTLRPCRHRFATSPNSIVSRMRHSGDPRVVITGIGVVSPFGVGRERFWQHVSCGCSGTRAISDFDPADFASRVAAPVGAVTIDDVPALDGDDIWDAGYRADPKRYSRAALIAVIAAREAWGDASLRIAEPGAGVVIGSGGGGIDVGERQYYDFFVERGRKVTPYAIPISIVGMMSSEISI